AEIADLDKQKELRLKEAQASLTAAEEKLAKAEAKLISMQEKQSPEISEQQRLVDGVSKELETEIENYSSALAEADSWYEDELNILNQAHAERLKSLDYINDERSRLFSIIDDPSQGLTDTIIDSNIDELIERLKEFQSEQQADLKSAESEYTARRNKEITKVSEDIERYDGLINEELGEDRIQLVDKIDGINADINELLNNETKAEEKLDAAKQAANEASTAKSDAEKAFKALGENGVGSAEETVLKNAEKAHEDAVLIETSAAETLTGIKSENQEPMKSLNTELAVLEKELDIMESNIWIKRLKTRIEEIEAEIALMETEIEDKQSSTEKAVNDINEDISIEIEVLEKLRADLKKDLKRGGLEKELALLDARTQNKTEKAESDYDIEVKDIYTTLLDAMYELEERIFQARIDAVNENNALILFDLEKDSQKQLESLEDDYIFSRRLLSQKVTKLKKEENSELPAAEEELVNLQDDYNLNVKNVKVETASKTEEIALEKESAVKQVKEEQKIVRLIYLQTDTPYKNTSFTVSVRNAGIPITFAEESSPLPLSIYTSLGYALLNVDQHRVILAAMLEYSFYEPITFGFGSEYIFNDLIYVRAGYLFGKAGQSFSVGFGLKSKIGTSQYGADYGFKPVEDYGYIHSFGINAQF
ncbi:MAG TPA: hypothetical protein DCO79_09530, partial [Spirochaeta sp.]|nr:hypothetical protein [Spirochaeta sp.]